MKRNEISKYPGIDDPKTRKPVNVQRRQKTEAHNHVSVCDCSKQNETKDTVEIGQLVHHMWASSSFMVI